MGINPLEFRELIVKPTLKKLGCWSPTLENLLIGTAAMASDMGATLKSDQGLGVYGIRQDVHNLVWDKFFAFDADLASAVRGLASQHEFLKCPHWELTTNFCYATAVAWGVYAYNNAILPEDAADVNALAHCWHLHFRNDNTLSPQHFIQSYDRLLVRTSEETAAA